MKTSKIQRWAGRIMIVLVICGLIAAVQFLRHVVDREQTSGIDYPDSEIAGELKILTPHWEGIRIEFTRGYNEWRIARGKKPVKVVWLDVGGTSDIVKYIRSAFADTPESIDVDIMFGGGTEPFMAFADEKLLAQCEVSAAILTNIPRTLHGQPVYNTNGYWYGAALSGFGILYNKIVLTRFGLPIPETWEDLTKPALRTWVGSSDLRKSGSTRKMYEIILQAYGWEKGMRVISAMAGNIRSFTASASTVPKDIAVGEIATGLCIDVYAWSTIREIGEDRLGFVLPKGLTVVNPDAIAMLKGAPEPGLAREFIEFVLSEAGQKIWMLELNTIPGAPTRFEINKMPVWPSLYAKYKDYCIFTDSPFDWKDAVQDDSRKSSLRWGILNDYIGTLFIDAHPECVKAWQRVCSLPQTNELYQLYMKHPLTEPELMGYATNQYLDTRWRSKAISEWGNDARRRYKEIIEH